MSPFVSNNISTGTVHAQKYMSYVKLVSKILYNNKTQQAHLNHYDCSDVEVNVCRTFRKRFHSDLDPCYFLTKPAKSLCQRLEQYEESKVEQYDAEKLLPM